MATPLPRNRASFSIEEIALITSGTIVERGAACSSVSTDSRNVPPGALFVALAGATFDAHDFLAAARSAGASVLLVQREVDASSLSRPWPGIVRVADTRRALGHLARAHRRRWCESAHPAGERRVVAITGSAGKTTTKTLVAHWLEAAAPGQVHAVAGNLNNDIGVPHTLFGLEPPHRFAVIELGSSGRGEIANLAAITEPDVAMLTLVAAAHTEGLGAIEEVATEKGDLLASVAVDGVAIANADDVRASGQLARSPASCRVTYGFATAATYRIVERTTLGTEGARVVLERPWGRIEMVVPLVGASGGLAAAGALAAVEAVLNRPLSDQEVRDGCLALGRGVDGRLKPVRLGDGTVVLDDTYNANPASMRSSIAAAVELAHHENRRLVLVLGEMRELGATSTAEHEALGCVAGSTEAAHVIGVGGHAASLVEAARRLGRNADFVKNAELAAVLVREVMRSGDVLLVKGSRGVATEKVVAAVVAATEDRRAAASWDKSREAGASAMDGGLENSSPRCARRSP